MLSDMAEGSADYETDHEYNVDEEEEDYEMSGDGSGRSGKSSHQTFRWQPLLTLSPFTGYEVGTPSFETNPPGTTTKEVNLGTTGAGIALRISSTTLVLSSLIVILFKQF